MKQLLFRLTTLLFVTSVSLGRAAVVTDGSFGAAGPLAGPNFIVPASLGKIAGGNLFHSFSQFGLTQGQSATFSGPGSVHNILARVTGGQVSSIDGTIRSTIIGANLFLLNPAGVIFGSNASIDVSGSFAVTTGQDIKLSDGSRFNATPSAADVLLTSAPPAAFGFLTATSGTISIQGSQLTSGNTLAFAAGNVRAKNATLNAGRVVIRGGQLTMDQTNVTVATTTGMAADVKMQTSIALTNQSSIQAIALQNFSNLTIASISAPAISIAGFSSVASIGGGGVSAGNLSLTADRLTLTEGGRLDASTFDAGRGGNINVSAHDILIRDGGSGIGAVSGDIGPGGNIHLVTNTLTIGAGALVQSSTFGPGVGGNVRVDAATVSIMGGSFLQTGITADTLGLAGGPAGNVQLNVTGQLTIAGGAQISSDTLGAGAGGDVMIAAQNALLDGAGMPVFTAISTQTSNSAVSGGAGGNIVLNIRDTLQLIGGGQVTASTFGSGPGGSVIVNAGRVFISAEGALLFSGISASSENLTIGGRSGDVRLTLSGSLEIVSAGAISVSTAGPGAGGSVNIAVPSISISGIGSSITAATLSGLNGGRGGNISITTNSLRGSDGGEISASTSGSGAGGSVDITAHTVSLDNFTIRADTTSPDTAEVPVTVSNLNVLFNLDHTNDQNLDLMLISPDGRMVDLFSGVGGDGHNFRNTILADDALTSIAEGHAPFTGRFRPLNPLAAFDGLPFSSANPWVLILTDFDPTDIATLNSWALRVGSTTVTSTDVPKVLPNPDGSGNNVSFLFVDLPPAAIVPITPGRGGDVRVHADSISLSGGARISAESANPAGSGHGGDIFVAAEHLNVVGALGIETGVSARSFGAGASGSVQLSLGSLTLDSFGFIGSSNTGSGEAGSVFVRVNNEIVLRHGSVITTSADRANAGVIDIESGASIKLHDSSITASAGTSGGSISITASDKVYLTDSSITATAGTQQTGGTEGGTGGNISIDPEFIILDHSLISANAAIGRGGNINLISSFFLDSESSITATGTQAGTVNIAAPTLDLSAALVTLSSSLLSAEAQLRERCTAQLRGDFSSFITLGRGGTEPAPDELRVEF